LLTQDNTLYYVKNHGSKITDHERRDIAAGFQEAVVDVLVQKTLKACVLKKVKDLVIGGGVVANRRLRERLEKDLKQLGIRVHLPEFALCQDNAAMVAGLGYQLYKRGKRSKLNLEVVANLKI